MEKNTCVACTWHTIAVCNFGGASACMGSITPHVSRVGCLRTRRGTKVWKSKKQQGDNRRSRKAKFRPLVGTSE
eukprot:1329327-Prymnesium_polylepis.3